MILKLKCLDDGEPGNVTENNLYVCLYIGPDGHGYYIDDSGVPQKTGARVDGVSWDIVAAATSFNEVVPAIGS